MNYEIFNFIQNRVVLLMASIGLILAFVILHRFCMSRLYAKLDRIKKSSFKIDQLEEVCSKPQGSNFNTMAIVSWNLLFMSIGMLFFLTPEIFGLSLLKVPQLASSRFGFLGFGIFFSFITFVLYISLPGIYGFYEISKKIKTYIFYYVPVMLLISMILSVYLTTIYPLRNDSIWSLSYIFMILGEILLVSPIFSGIGGRLK